jgi:hypothetical protein
MLWLNNFIVMLDVIQLATEEWLFLPYFFPKLLASSIHFIHGA